MVVLLIRLGERWTLLRPNIGTADALTGNTIPALPTEIRWRGLLQQRLVNPPHQEEVEPGVVVSELVLLLDPGLPGGTSRRDRWRFDGPVGVSDIVSVGGVVTVQGSPRVRRPARGSRRPAYIAAIVKHSSDME